MITPIKILLADDHLLFVESLSAWMQRISSLSVVGTVANGIEALDFVAQQPVDIVLADIRMKQMNGIELAHKMSARFPDVKVVALTQSYDIEHIEASLEAGMAGYLLKDISGKELVAALHEIADGKTYLQDLVKRQLGNQPPELADFTEQQKSIELTAREKEIIRMIISEMTNHQIAEILTISEATVKKHRSNIYRKLNVHTSLALLRVVERYNLLD